MNNEPTYKKIINLLDFADELIPLADPGGPEYMDANPIFMTPVHIEEVLDTYGRGMAHRSMVDTGVDSDQIAEASSSINKRLNELRNHIRELAQKHDFDQALKDSAEEAFKNWHKRSEEEQLKFKE